MAVYTPSGSVSFNLNVNSSFSPGTTNAQVLTAYTVPISASPIQSAIYSGTTSGTGSALQIVRVLQYSGTLAATATTTATILSFTSGGTNNVDVGGGTATWQHIRDITVFNDGYNPTTGFVTTDVNILKWDMSTGTITTSWGLGTTAGFGPIEGTASSTVPVFDIPAGSYQRFAKPFGATGWSVDATHVTLNLAVPSANTQTINYRIVVMGD